MKLDIHFLHVCPFQFISLHPKSMHIVCIEEFIQILCIRHLYRSSLCLSSLFLALQDGWNSVQLAVFGGHTELVRDLVDNFKATIDFSTDVCSTVYTIRTVHCTLCTVQTIHTAHCTLCTVQTIRTVHCTLCTVQTIHTAHCTLCTVYTIHTVHCTLCTVYMPSAHHSVAFSLNIV